MYMYIIDSYLADPHKVEQSIGNKIKNGCELRSTP